MSAARKQLSFIIIGVLAAFIMAAFCRPLAADCLSVLANGWGEQRYDAAAASGDAIALVSRADETFRLTTGTLDGDRTAVRTVTLPVSAAECTVAGIYPAADGSVLLGLYEPADSAAENLTLYRIPAEGEPERLLLYPCTGDTADERMANTFFSTFTEQEGEILFALVDDGTAQAYTYGGAGSGLAQGGTASAYGAVSAAVLSDGTIALGGQGWLELDGASVDFSLDNSIVTQLTQVGAGLFYIDSASLKVFYSDLIGQDAVEVLDLSRSGQMDGLTSLSLTRDGSALLLRDGRTLELVTANGTQQLGSLLYRSGAACVAILVGLVLLWLVLTALAWYLLCGRKRSYLPLAIRSGGILAVCALVIGTVGGSFIVRPMVRSTVAQEVQSVLASAAAMAAGGTDTRLDALPERVTEGLSSLSVGDYAAASAVVYEQNGDAWVVSSDGGRLPAGARAAMVPGFSAGLAEQALQNGSAFEQVQGMFRLCVARDGQVLQITLTDSALADRIDRAAARGVYSLWAGLAVLWAAAVIVLLLVGRRLGRISRAMEQLSSGDTDTQLSMPTGDELEGLSTSFNSMARAMKQQEDGLAGMIRAYLRFVPERVLGLLGKASIMEVDKRTYASRRMAAMMVWFEFPDRVYDHSTRVLFENINEVIERTAAIVARKGGTVFNFAYNGYDVVLSGGEVEAVSTAVAVQQEVLALNEQRAMNGQPTVTLRIALDVGEVMIGIVGDENQMEPATISASFTTARQLIGLAQRLEAGILCTENVIAGAEDYGSRYMGKSRQGDEMIRVDEIFEGDPYGMRRGKATTGRQFSQGVFALYSHDFETAKRIFLELVYDHPDDGGARYYLYLADRLEKQPDQEISLEY